MIHRQSIEGSRPERPWGETLGGSSGPLASWATTPAMGHYPGAHPCSHRAPSLRTIESLGRVGKVHRNE